MRRIERYINNGATPLFSGIQPMSLVDSLAKIIWPLSGFSMILVKSIK